VAAARVAAFAMFDYFGSALQRADFAYAGDVPAIPFDSKLEILIRVEPFRVHSEFCHSRVRLRLNW